MPYQRDGARDPDRLCRGWQVFNASTRRQDSLTPESQTPAELVRAHTVALVPGQIVPMLGERVYEYAEPGECR